MEAFHECNTENFELMAIMVKELALRYLPCLCKERGKTMSKQKITYCMRVITFLVVLTSFLGACGPAASSGQPDQPQVEAVEASAEEIEPSVADDPTAPPQFQLSAPAPKQANPSTFTDDEAGEIVAHVESLMRDNDVAALADLVRDDGLVIVPYAVGAPDQGLTGEALTDALSVMLDGAQPSAIAYADQTEDKLEIILAGFNPVKVTPAVGDALTISNWLAMTLIRKPQGNWQIWAIAVDEDGMLFDRIDNPRYVRLAQADFSADDLAIIEIIDSMQAEEIEALMKLVPEEGLVLVPYGVGAPEVGLTGEALRETLHAMLEGTELYVEGYAGLLSPDLTGIIVTGLNPVEVRPSVGDPFTMSGYTLVELEKISDGDFYLTSLAVDVHGVMAEALAYPPFTDDPSLLSDQQARAIIGDLEKSLQAGDVDALVKMVNYRGLIVGPYAVGLPNRGLTGEALREALEAVLDGAQPEVVSYQLSVGGLSIVVEGLNSVQVAPAHGNPLTISSPALLGLTQDVDGSWILWSVIADHSGDLEDMLVQTPYWPWK